jgi:hypothetical protein
MTKPSSFSTLCTSNCAFELTGLLLSLSVYHTNETIYILSDTKTKTIIDSITPQPRLNIIWYVELDEYDGMNRKIMEAKNIWSDFQMSKAKIIKYALDKEKDTLFLDCDIIITNSIDDIDTTKDIGVSPQFLKKEILDLYGVYNGGVLWVKHKQVPDDWIKFTKTSRFYDQASIEDLVNKYTYFEFEDNYNLHTWRFIHADGGHQEIISYITSKNNDTIYYKNKQLKFIHTHFLEDIFKPYNNIIIQHLHNAQMYKILAIIYRVINNKWILKIPKQPQQGIFMHSNDSYRELAILLKIKNSDVDILYDSKTTQCWLEPNILTYDRPTLQWCNQEIINSSLLLLGNGDINVEGKILKENVKHLNIKPWIFWPRKPMLLEKILKEKQILSYQDRKIESIFIGNYENNVQEQFRNMSITHKNWKDVISEYHCTKGHTYKFTHEEYLLKIRDSRYGLCLRGFGSKCHREVELMAFGTVLIITPEVSIKSYSEPLIENTHYIYVSNPEELKSKLDLISIETWCDMSNECYTWYQRNIHSNKCWTNMISHILYD